ncbi:hypothetical protein U9M48_042403 [Paspalum notatum var. saurae]|uniref:Uncharacterized protein n=1 Tax=Paspalum notatum var. saurae TaxID=547442 RepID=A0AAQ3USJ1_PASNO
MAIRAARVHLATAHASLPALLPTPAKSSMLPLLAPSCVLILPMSPPKTTPSPSKGSRADAEGRWDVRKSGIIQSPTKSQLKPGRADAVERWDAHKIRPSGIPMSPWSWSQRSWDSRSSSFASSSSSHGAPTSRASSSDARWDSNKRAINRSPSSAERWDAHKKPRPPPAEELHGGESDTGSNDDMPQPQKQEMYAGPAFLASPEPSKLPMPTLFMVRTA